MGVCERCECHSHASQCDKEYGACIGCQHNTEVDKLIFKDFKLNYFKGRPL